MAGRSHVGTQRGKDPDQLVPADAVFEIPVEAVTASDGTAGFRGA
ncbi:hypothetical protein [Streptomyces lunaelactis]|nr:hypothetical protein [Streptomyces lunaelactis]